MISILTYQDYIESAEKGKLSEFVRQVVAEHKSSRGYQDAQIADLYDAQKNKTINDFSRSIFDACGRRVTDETASNMRLPSNFFAQLNNQRCKYSLGNGLIFQKEDVKGKLGFNADKEVADAGYFGLIHGVSFLYWAYDHIHLFKLTEFAPLLDEDTGDLGAGVRFWQLDERKPLQATLYTPEGYLEFRAKEGNISGLEMVDGMLRPYRMTVKDTPATTGEVETAHNYSTLPIVPLWGSRLHQSTLVGMRTKIDAYDIVASGYANDMQDCPQIYWLINGAGGMGEKELSAFRERLLFRHIAAIKGGDDISIMPYTQEIPYQARQALLAQLRDQIYSDFGGLDTENISASAKTATEINAAYQPLDENADDFEYQVIDAVQKLLALQGVSAEDATPQFKRNRISDQQEQTQMVMTAAPYLDDEAVLNHIPWLTPEEVDELLKRRAAEEIDRIEDEVPEAEVTEDE